MDLQDLSAPSSAKPGVLRGIPVRVPLYSAFLVGFMNYKLSVATLQDVDAIGELIPKSARALGVDFYTSEQIEGALKETWGTDTRLISDGTYFVIHAGRALAACGGWSFRETLFGNDSAGFRDDQIIDPACGAAKIRAFFVDPDHVRKGLGSMLVKACENAARAKGFSSLELMATLPGQKLYEKHGFIAMTPVDHPLSGDLTIRFIPMHRNGI